MNKVQLFLVWAFEVYWFARNCRDRPNQNLRVRILLFRNTFVPWSILKNCRFLKLESFLLLCKVIWVDRLWRNYLVLNEFQQALTFYDIPLGYLADWALTCFEKLKTVPAFSFVLLRVLLLHYCAQENFLGTFAALSLLLNVSSFSLASPGGKYLTF